MERPLAGRLILILEDEPLISGTVDAFECAGAQVLRTRRMQDAVRLIERDDLSAAVLDGALDDGDSSQLFERLKELDIPFVRFSGVGGSHDGRTATKQADPAVMVVTLSALLRSRVN